MKRATLALLAVLGICLAACGSSPTVSGQAPTGSRGASEAGSAGGTASVATPGAAIATPVLAFYATSRAALALTASRLLLSTDGGVTWAQIPAPQVGQTPAVLVAPDGALVVASADGVTVNVASSHDQGRTWNVNRLDSSGQPGAIRLLGFPDLLIVADTLTTSANFSEAEIFVSRRGAPFQHLRLPVAGRLSIVTDSEWWLAGGPLSNQLWMTANGGESWLPVAPPAALGSAFALSPPVQIGEELVLAGTMNGPRSREGWFATRDRGRSWRQIAVLPVAGETGDGVVLPASLAGDGVIVAGPGGTIVAASPAAGAATPISPNGIGPTIGWLQFVDRTRGWALATEAVCEVAKTGCSETTSLFRTTDGGQNWQAADLSTGQ